MYEEEGRDWGEVEAMEHQNIQLTINTQKKGIEQIPTHMITWSCTSKPRLMRQ